VEGFETEVLMESDKILIDSDLKAIIIELNGSGIRYGHDDVQIHGTLLNLDFRSFHYDPKERLLTPMNKFNTDGNTIICERF
jgi:hypothetical protein